MAWGFKRKPHRRRLTRKSSRDPSTAQIAQIKRMALRVAKLRGKSRREQALVLADLMEEAGWPRDKNKVPTGRRGRSLRLQVYGLDVWGNAEDGYDINERYSMGRISLPVREYLYNVEHYRDHLRKEHDIFRRIRTSYEWSRDELFRLLTATGPGLAGSRGWYLASNLPRRQVVFFVGELDAERIFIDINRARDGKPLLVLEEVRE